MLRNERLRQGLSQAALAERIVQRSARDPMFAELGVVTEKAISNLEAATHDPARFVRPRAQTVRVLLAALNIAHDSPQEAVMLNAADITRRRVPDPVQTATVDPAHAETLDARAFIADGRQHHVDMLWNAWNRARSGKPQIIFLAGDAGVGKTRMVRQLCADIQRRHGNVMISWGECTSGAASIEPYLPFRQAINGIVDPTYRTDDAHPAWDDATYRALLTSSHRLVPVLLDESTLRHRFAERDSLMRTELERVLESRFATDTPGRFDYFVRLLTDWSSSWPIVLVLEDLHWAGDETCALLLHLQRQLQRSTTTPLLIIGTYRPSDLALTFPEGRHPLTGTLNEVSRASGNPILDLSTSLGSEAGLAFIHGLIDRLPISPNDYQVLAKLLFERTEGHPLFAIELLEWMRDANVLVQAPDGTWRLETQNIGFFVPDKVRAVVAERVERLQPHVRSILEIASVQGTSVNIDILASVAGVAVDDVTQIVDVYLDNRYRLLQPGPAITVEDRRFYLYAFRHAIFQEYLYETLSPRRRETLHRETANAAIRLFGDTNGFGDGEIAFHLARAYMPREAASYAHRAATAALRALDYDLANIWMQRTEEYALAAKDLRVLWDVRTDLVAVMRGTGLLDEGMALATKIIQQANADGYPEIEAEAHNLIAQIHYDRSQLTDAVVHLETAIAMYRELELHAEISGSESMLSHTWFRLGAYDDAWLHAQRSFEEAQLAGDDPFAAEALLAIGNCEMDLGLYEAAIQTYTRARPIYARSGELRGEVLTWLNSALCHVQLGQWQQALTMLIDVNETYDILRTRRLHAFWQLYLGFAYEAAGRYGDAVDAYTGSLDTRREIGLLSDACDNLAGLLRVAIANTDMASVRTYLGDLVDWLGHHDVSGIEQPVRVYLSMAIASEMMGDPDAARMYLSRGHELLMERANRISDTAMRESYLTNVPSNRQIQQCYAVQKVE